MKKQFPLYLKNKQTTDTHYVRMGFKMSLKLVFVRCTVLASFRGTLQQDVRMSLDDMPLQAVFSDGGIIALRTVMEVLFRVSSHMCIVVHLIPEKLTCQGNITKSYRKTRVGDVI